jgi:energy-coupling factor transporter transmembrane protein EcfT
MANPLTLILWLVVLICFSYFVAGFCAFIYIWVYPLTVCFPALKDISDLMLQGLQFPHYCAEKMVS